MTHTSAAIAAESRTNALPAPCAETPVAASGTSASKLCLPRTAELAAALSHSAPRPATTAGFEYCSALRDQHRQLVDEAPRPVLARLQRSDDRVARASGVCDRLEIRRIVATAVGTACEAVKVRPFRPNRQAVLATLDGLGQLHDAHVVKLCARLHKRQFKSTTGPSCIAEVS